MSTFSATVVVNDLTYIFFNETDDDGLQFIRFKDTNEKLKKAYIGDGNGKIKVKGGNPVAGIRFNEPDKTPGIRLYYFDDANMVHEIKLLNPQNLETNPEKDWQQGSNSLTLAVNSVRQASAGSYLSASVRNNGKLWQPAVIFSPKEQKTRVVMASINQKDQWELNEVYNPHG